MTYREEVDSHFDPLGALSFELETGEKLGIEMYACKACGSLIVLKDQHWDTHKQLNIAGES